MSEISAKEQERIKKEAEKTGTLCCSNCQMPSGFMRITLRKRYLILHSGRRIKIYLCQLCDKGVV